MTRDVSRRRPLELAEELVSRARPAPRAARADRPEPPLREEERQAWQRIIRVLGHEINNSLAPIKSIAHSLERLLTREPARRGLGQRHAQRPRVGSRADSLGRFTAAYASSARLPGPALQPCRRRARAARRRPRTRMPMRVHAGPAVTLQADPDQIEQLLINMIRNAVDATSHRRRRSVGWDSEAACAFSWTTKDPGSPNTSNSSSPSSRPSRRDPASASCSAARLPRPTAARSRSRTARRARVPRVLTLPLA